jgi:hypothetical protein
MPEPHDDVIRATREFIEASAGLRDALVHAEEGLLKGIDVLEQGGTPMQNLRTPQTKVQRTSVQTAMEQFSEARHRFRMLMISECVNDGMKARELSEMWGFSRQRASKLIGESRCLEPSGARAAGVEPPPG